MLLDFSDRTRTGISKLISRCALIEGTYTFHLLHWKLINHTRLSSFSSFVVPFICAFQVRYSLTGDSVSGGRSRRDLRPVLGQFEKMTSDSLSIQKDCGPDNKCIPNLSLGATQ